MEPNPIAGYWIARNRDAHAWVEAYDENQGWFIVEATPGDGVPQPLARGRLAYLWDYFKQRMKQMRQAITVGGLKELAPYLLTLGAAIFTFLFSTRYGIALLALFALGLLWRSFRRRSKGGTAHPEPAYAALQCLLRDVDRHLGKRGISRKPAETLHRFAGRLRDPKNSEEDLSATSAWYLRYAELRYSSSLDEKDIGALERSMPTS